MNKSLASLTAHQIDHELEYLYFELGRIGRDPFPIMEKIAALEKEQCLRKMAKVVGPDAVEHFEQGKYRPQIYMRLQKDQFPKSGEYLLLSPTLKACFSLLNNGESYLSVMDEIFLSYAKLEKINNDLADRLNAKR